VEDRAGARRPVVVAMHARSGLVGLNVVTAALDADPRTENLDVRFVKDPAAMIRELQSVGEARQPALALWSFYSPDFTAAADDLVAVKDATAGAVDVLHIAGGVHATAEPLATLRAGFDLVAVGEGEHTTVAIVVALLEGRDPRDLPGTAHLAGERLVSHGPGERHPLDAYPAFNARYKKWNALEITRGCVYACSFCQTPYMFKARFRHRSLGDVRRHVDQMRLSGSRFVRFLTPTSLSYGSADTSPDLGAVDALLQTVREGAGAEAKIFFGTFPSEIRPEHVTPEALAILARWADNRTIVIGGQSGSDRILEETRRGHTVDDVIRAVELSVAAGFRPDVDFLLGLPGETLLDRTLSMKLADRLVGMGARIHSHAFMPLPGTPLRDATPSVIEEETSLAMARLESRGKAYGQWRRQLLTAENLVRARRGQGRAVDRE
jgi:B12-binding domain/radical SAM domain protein